MTQKVNKMTLNPRNLGMKPKALLASNSHALTNLRVFSLSQVIAWNYWKHASMVSCHIF